MRKIVYCIETITTCGGREKIVVLKANYLVNLGWDVSIIQNIKGSDSLYWDISPKIHIYEIDTQYHSENPHYLSRILHRKRMRNHHIREYEKILNNIKPDIVVSTFCDELPFLYKIKDGSKKVLEIHASKSFRISLAKEMHLGWKGAILAIIRTFKDCYYASQYDAFVCLTYKDAPAWGKMKNLHVISNPITIPDKGAADTTVKRVIAVGRLSSQKRMDILIRCWAKIPMDIRNGWILDIYGNGELELELKKEISDLQVNDSVAIKAPVTNITDEYLKSSIYCSTAAYEGFSLAMCEAMSAGLPIVTFDHPCGASDMILDKSMGMLVPMWREDLFVERLTMLMTNPEIRKTMGANARKSIYERYTMDVIMKKWTDLFGSLSIE